MFVFCRYLSQNVGGDDGGDAKVHLVSFISFVCFFFPVVSRCSEIFHVHHGFHMIMS